jgi:molybdopterin-guanine dinucleotide biosynthesis protein
VGLVKNAGKTETLNFILRHLKTSGKTVAVTSIGLDGEQFDQIYGTPKPEITIYEGMIFVTAQKFFDGRTFEAEILFVSELQTTLGRLVTACAKSTGKVILSGAADTHTLRKIIAQNATLGADISIVDGATSRLSLASPTVTDAMILATGAALSANIEQLVKKTAFAVSLVSLPDVAENLQKLLSETTKGLWCIDEKFGLKDLKIESSFLLKNSFDHDTINILQQNNTLFCGGAVSDRLLEFLLINILSKKDKADFTIIVKDFSRLFISPAMYSRFVIKGGKIAVLHRTKLIAVTINPTSPEGFVLNSEKLQDELRKKIAVEVLDVMKIQPM